MRINRSHLLRVLASVAGASLFAAGCVGDVSTGDDQTDPSDPGLPGDPGGTSGGPTNTFNHPDPPDPWSILSRILAEGPPEYTAHVHSCMKTKYATFGNILSSRGVSMTAAKGNTTSAAALYTAGGQSLGVANYAQRTPEATDITTAGASKELDIYSSAAPEIIAAIPNRTECQKAGVAATMFDATGACTAQGIECITGLPAQPAEIELCSQIVLHASSPTKGQNMAVAVTMAAAQICE